MKGYWMASMMEPRIKHKSKVNKVAARKHFYNQENLGSFNDSNKENELEERKQRKSKDKNEAILDGFNDGIKENEVESRKNVQQQGNI